MLGAYTMEKLCVAPAGDFRCFVRDVFESHLGTKAPDWLVKLLDAQEHENNV